MIAPEIAHPSAHGTLFVESDDVVACWRDADQAVGDRPCPGREARVLPDAGVARLDPQPIEWPGQKAHELLIAEFDSAQFCRATVDDGGQIVRSELRTGNIDQSRGTGLV